MGLSSKEVGEPLGWPQIGNAWLDIPSPDGQARSQQQQQRQPQLKCPRCDSYNTKFCYYNNYSRLQPRHFCKACRRYWTAGGTLRNVPVGGGRKNKRQKKTAQADSADSDPYAACNESRSMNSAQFVNEDLESTVFPDVFQQIMLYPPSMSPNQGGSSSGGSSGMSLLSPPPPQPPLLLHELTETYSGSAVFNPPPISASASSSHHSNQIRQEVTADDLLLTLMPGSTAGTWLQDPPPLLSRCLAPPQGRGFKILHPCCRTTTRLGGMIPQTSQLSDSQQPPMIGRNHKWRHHTVLLQ